MICPQCHEPNPQNSAFCLNCGAELITAPPKPVLSPISHTVSQRYSNLRRVANVYIALGVLVAIIGTMISIRVFESVGFSGSLVVGIVGSIPVVLLCSSGERIKVTLDTEENTRRAAEYQRQILEALRSQMGV